MEGVSSLPLARVLPLLPPSFPTCGGRDAQRADKLSDQQCNGQCEFNSHRDLAGGRDPAPSLARHGGGLLLQTFCFPQTQVQFLGC